ncbi:E3 ubiquitin-protein ligase TRIM21-like [Kryptolebias marmoratus]|uniref:E3 ubiquitin-protein ligase TRIM21-like n=1 Tax=Kryptolebias marmoratus TaxID=37003 RepID=A0A3Q3GT04_KRYMA|nr:E3 ubiquitin-protein ligase TRIM21-like [Kryptolebias marmoratus]
MASAKSLITEEQVCCSICLDVFTKPASIPCGHTFCLDCITTHWAIVNTLFQCPLCKEEFYPKPMLRVNIFIAEMAEKFKNTVKSQSSSAPEQTGSGKVLCNLCTEPKSTAIKSCLVCFLSYCQTHLERHEKIPALMKHKLIHTVDNLESRLCKNHDEPFEFFCGEDQMFLCESCKNGDHKKHKIVNLEEEAQTRKQQLGTEKKCTDQMIHARQQKIDAIQCSLKASKSNAEEAVSYSRDRMTALVDYIKKSQNELSEVIDIKLKTSEKEAEDFIKELNAEITEIKLKNQQLNNISLTDDPFRFLENVLSLTISSPQVKDWSNVRFNPTQCAIQETLAKLETSVTTEINKLCDPSFKEKQKYAVNVTFDPDTANAGLNVSADGKRVTHGNQRRKVPNKPERFDHVLNVLAKQGFSSGKFYYEVQVKDKTQWDLGVVYESINRKGDIRLSPKNGYWTIWLRKGEELTANAGPPISLDVRKIPEKVGVFVDYEEGQVSFYDVDVRANIFSFFGCAFTGKLFPFFSPCSNDKGKNLAPLIITPITYKK